MSCSVPSWLLPPRPDQREKEESLKAFCIDPGFFVLLLLQSSPPLSLSLSLAAGGTRHHATEISEEKCVGVTSYRLLPPDQWEASFFAGCWGGGRARPPIRTFFLVPRRVGRGAGDTAAVLGQSTLHIAFKCWGFKYLTV